MSRKILAAFLAAIMLAAALIGCQSSPASSQGAASSGSAESGGASPKEDYVFQYILPGADDSKSMDNEVGKKLYEMFGVQINIVGYAGDWEEKCAQMLAGGDYPDMVQLQSNTMVKKYINAGALLDIGELAEKNAPNFLSFYADAIPYWKRASDDGKLYKWTANTPDVEHATTARFDMIIRSDILEQQGWPEVLDEDSYVALLKKGLADNPETDGNDTLGFVIGASEEWILSDCMQQLASKGRYPEYNMDGMAWDTDQDQYVDVVLDVPAWKSGWKFWNRLYREGIMDPECFTDTDAVAGEKFNNGRALSSVYITWEMGTYNNNLVNAGKENMQYVTMPIMLREQIDAGEKRIIPVIDSYDYQSVVITKNAKHPDRIMEVVNWICTEEGQNLIGWGVEGTHYTVGSDGKKTVTQDFLDCRNGKIDKSFNLGVGTYYFMGLSAGYDKNEQVYNVSFDESIGNVAMSDRLKEVYSHYGWETVTDPWKNNKQFGYKLVHDGVYNSVALEPGSEAETTATKLREYKTKSYPTLIMASSDEEFESKWTEFIDGYKSLKPESVLAEYNRQVENTKKELK